jgi:hypothetical protein
MPPLVQLSNSDHSIMLCQHDISAPQIVANSTPAAALSTDQAAPRATARQSQNFSGWQPQHKL